MTEADIEIILECTKEAQDHLRQWVADLCQRLQGIHSGFGHDPCLNFAVTIPNRNRKIKRCHKSLRGECTRPENTPLGLDVARLLDENSGRFAGSRPSEERRI